MWSAQNWCECHMWRETNFALFSLPSSSALFIILRRVNVKICLRYLHICPWASKDCINVKKKKKTHLPPILTCFSICPRSEVTVYQTHIMSFENTLLHPEAFHFIAGSYMCVPSCIQALAIQGLPSHWTGSMFMTLIVKHFSSISKRVCHWACETVLSGLEPFVPLGACGHKSTHLWGGRVT